MRPLLKGKNIVGDHVLSSVVVECGGHLTGDLDLAGLVLLGLGDPDAENSVFHASLHILLVDTVREAERSSKLADAALRDPVLGLVLRLMLDLLVLILSDDLGLGLASFVLIFDGSLVALMLLLAALSDGASGLLTLDLSTWRCAGGV